ncbi:MAG: sulfur carrier protein ThiS [Cytophagaceae bacterium]|nr:sulfur carrier protein ThiS [Cytophagaceae bacterium]MDW8456898.1 sulfur carrier protein ThiS [Cytophagaceae bacterium]
MVITINNTSVEINSSHNITELLRQLHLHNTKGIAIAINDMVIPKSKWNEITFNESDKVTIIKATQGG